MKAISYLFIRAGLCPSICLCGILRVPVWWYLKYDTVFSISSSFLVSLDTRNDFLILPLRWSMSTFFPIFIFCFMVCIFRVFHGCPIFPPRVLNASSADFNWTSLKSLSNGRKSLNHLSREASTLCILLSSMITLISIRRFYSWMLSDLSGLYRQYPKCYLDSLQGLIS